MVDASVLLVAALVCATSLIEQRTRRLSVQATLVLVMAAASMFSGAPLRETAMVAGLLAVVAGVATRYTVHIRLAETDRRAEHAPRRRNELLETVRELPAMDVSSAAAAVCASLRSLGFDVGAASLVRGDRLVSIGNEGVPYPNPLPLDQGMAGRAVLERQTITVADYTSDPDRLPWVTDIGSAIATPIWAGPDLVGVLVAARHAIGAPNEEDIEVAEVLAAHLGAVIATRRRVENQRTLLERMDRLDSMRTAFADEVSDELRHPLTIVRGAGNTLLAHGDQLDTSSRSNLLDRMCDQADELQQVIDALLDFSRFQASHHEAHLRSVTVAELFESLEGRIDLDAVGSTDLELEADPDLIRHAVELLIGGRTARIRVIEDGWSATISIAGGNPGAHTLMRSLVAQLVVEGGGVLDPSDEPAITLLLADRDLEAVL